MVKSTKLVIASDDVNNEFGDLLKSGQEQTKRFSHVSKIWTEGKDCYEFDILKEELEKSANQTTDGVVHLSQLQPIICDDKLQMKITGGKFDDTIWELSDNAITQFSQRMKITPKLFYTPETFTEREYISEFIKERMKNVVGDNDPEMFLRFRENGVNSIRAFLTTKYQVIDHRFVVNSIEKLIPSGLVSHFDLDQFKKNNGDYLRFNVLIPDSIRQEDDSDYGGMISTSNNEVGRGRFGFSPSIFRYICMNGCIWNQQEGEAFSQWHKGEIDSEVLFRKIRVCLHSQIPLVTSGIDRMMTTKSYKSDVGMLQLIVNLTNDKDLMITQKQAANIYLASTKEDLGDNAFSFINAITRSAQTENVFVQDKLELYAGNFMDSIIKDTSNWDRYTSQSEGISVKLISKVLNTLSV